MSECGRVKLDRVPRRCPGATMRASAIFWGLLAFAACGSTAPKPYSFERSSITPAAVGEVAATAGPNGNTQLAITVRHLAPPANVTPGATVYVVWATELGAEPAPRNLGALRVDNNLNGRLETLTPLRSFDITITANRLKPPMHPPARLC